MKIKLHFLLLIFLTTIYSCKFESKSSLSSIPKTDSDLSTLINDDSCKSNLKQPQTINLEMPVQEANAAKLDLDQIPKIVSSTFAGEKNAWFITDFDRKIFHSADCGGTWKEIQTNSDEKPQAIYFIDSKKGWLLTSGILAGSILHTQDGGESWLKIGQIDYGLANEMFFANDKKGLIFGYFSYWQTDDGGKTWTEIHSEKKYDGQPNDIESLDQYVDLIMAAKFDKKNDKKNTDIRDSLKKEISLYKEKVIDIDFLNRENIAIVRNYGISFTKNGGETWQEALISNKGGKIYFSSVDLIDETKGWIAGYAVDEENVSRKYGQSVALKTEDGWQTWQIVFKADNEPFFTNIKFVDESKGWIVGRDGIYRTNDGGTNWYSVLKLNFE